jgi:hypothetical protein
MPGVPRELAEHALEVNKTARLKDRLGDQRGGSEWELIKVLLEGD